MSKIACFNLRLLLKAIIPDIDKNCLQYQKANSSNVHHHNLARKRKNDFSGPCALNWYDYMFWSKKEFLLKLEYELVLHFFTLFEVNFPAFYLMIEGFYIITIKKLLSLNTDKSRYSNPKFLSIFNTISLKWFLLIKHVVVSFLSTC